MINAFNINVFLVIIPISSYLSSRFINQGDCSIVYQNTIFDKYKRKMKKRFY